MKQFMANIFKKVSSKLLLALFLIIGVIYTGVVYSNSSTVLSHHCKTCAGPVGDQECYTVNLGDYWCTEDASGDCASGGECSS